MIQGKTTNNMSGRMMIGKTTPLFCAATFKSLRTMVRIARMFIVHLHSMRNKLPRDWLPAARGDKRAVPFAPGCIIVRGWIPARQESLSEYPSLVLEDRLPVAEAPAESVEPTVFERDQPPNPH